MAKCEVCGEEFPENELKRVKDKLVCKDCSYSLINKDEEESKEEYVEEDEDDDDDDDENEEE